jgi:hypothetical protein
MVLEDISGIVSLDESAMVKDVDNGRKIMTMSLCTVLLKYLQLSDWHQLIAEIHQAKEPMAPVQAVVPNTPEAECMIVMMNKNLPAYIGNVLRDQGLPEEFVLELFRQTCCQTTTMFLEVSLTMWDVETGTLTTAKELAQYKSTADLKKAAWFKDAFFDLDLNQSKVKKPSALPPEALFDLDGERFIKTIHECHMNQTTTTAGSPPPKTDNMELVNMANLDDEDSTSLSNEKGLHAHSNQGVDETSPASSAEEGQDEHTANGG